MKIEIIAKALKELGHPTRLKIFKRLVQSGHQGIAVGVIQQELDVPGSTLSHHISSLVSADLITQRREGRTLFCVVNYDNLQAVVDFFQDDCCVDEKANT